MTSELQMVPAKPMLTKEEFLEKVKEGDPDAFSKLGNRYEVVSCFCTYVDCRGWRIQLTAAALHADNLAFDKTNADLQSNRK